MTYLSLGFVVFGVILILCALGRGGAESNKFGLIVGVLSAFVAAPAAWAYEELGCSYSGELLFSVGGIVGGILIVSLMIWLLMNTSPHSTDFGQFMIFGWFKADNFAEWLIGGLIILFIAGQALYSNTSRAIEYKRANDSVRKCEAERLARSKDAPTLATTKKTSHESTKHKKAHSKSSTPKKAALSR